MDAALIVAADRVSAELTKLLDFNAVAKVSKKAAQRLTATAAAA